MLTGPQQKFCEGIVAGKSATEAYADAYPKSSEEAACSSASALLRNPKIHNEIARMRAKAEEMAGSAVLTLAEKRKFLARLVRADLLKGEVAGDLVQAVEPCEHGRKIRLGDKLKAIELDNDLAGEGSDASADDALSALLERIRK